MKDRTLEQKIKNAQARVLEFDDQIDGPSKMRLAQAVVINKSDVLRDIALRARKYLIIRRGEIVEFLKSHGATIPTRGI